MANNVYGSAQNYIAEKARNTNIREKMGVATTGIQDLVDIYRRQQKYKQITAAMGKDPAMDPGAETGVQGYSGLPPEAQYGLDQNAQDLKMLQAGLDVNNIDKFAEVYDKYASHRPDISKLISASRIAKIRADAMSQVANARANAAIKLQRDKLNYGADGDPSGLSGSDPLRDFDSDMQAGYGSDQAIFGGE